LAYREKRRRDSLTASDEIGPIASTPGPSSSPAKQKDYFSVPDSEDKQGAVSQVSGALHGLNGAGTLPTPAQSRVGSYEQMMGQGQVLSPPVTPPPGLADPKQETDANTIIGLHNELEEKEMFLRLEKPRVRYDVEVVTKLVVYTGIAWLAVEINPIIFEIIGLGMG
jgi:hypothetical protein